MAKTKKLTPNDWVRLLRSPATSVESMAKENAMWTLTFECGCTVTSRFGGMLGGVAHCARHGWTVMLTVVRGA